LTTLLDVGQSTIHGCGVFLQAAVVEPQHLLVVRGGKWAGETDLVGTHVYGFELPQCPLLVLDVTDAPGPARFPNHSCNPNCEVAFFRSHSGDPVLAVRPVVRLFCGEELTLGYGAQYDGQCACGDMDCTGRIGQPPKNPSIRIFTGAPMDADAWRRAMSNLPGSALVCTHRSGPLNKADIESLLDDGCALMVILCVLGLRDRCCAHAACLCPRA